MATAQSLIDATQARAKDTGKTQWSDTELLAYLNGGLDYIHKLLIQNKSELSLKYNATAITTSAATETYDLPTDFWALFEGDKLERTAVCLIDTDEYLWLEECAPGESIEYTFIDDDRPTKFYVNETKLGLLPVPDAAYTIKLKYYFSSPSLALGGIVPWSGLFSEPLKSFVSSRAFARNGMITVGEDAIFNELKDNALNIISMREGRRSKIRVRVK